MVHPTPDLNMRVYVWAPDMLCYLGREPNDMTRVEGFDLDSTMAALTGYAQTNRDSITLVLKRLVKRQTLQV